MRLLLLPARCALVLLALQALACAGQPTVSIMPPARVGDGKCLRDLFLHPEQWKETRGKVDLLFYAGHQLHKQFKDDELGKWLPMLKKWKLKFGLEVGAVKEWGTTGKKVFNVQRPMWDRFQRLGGRIHSLAMDEPLWAVRHHFKVKKKIIKSDQYAIKETANFVVLVRKHYPRVLIGDIEPYPAIPFNDMISWIDGLQAELKKRGVRGLDFFRLDVNWVHPKFKTGGGWREVKKLEDACRKRKLPFHLIYWAADFPGLKRKGLAKESTWYTSVLRQAREYAAVGGCPDEYVIESWIPAPPHSVPETAEWTFTRSVLDLAKKYVGGRASRLILSNKAKCLGRIKPFWRTTPVPDRWLELNKGWIRTLPETYRNAPRYKGKDVPKLVIPFCDTVSAVRILGGWDKKWKYYPGGVDERLDLAYRKGGKLAYRWKLLHARMDDFIENNINMLIVLDNVPHCFARKPSSGTYGQVMGPDDPKEYGRFIRELCREIVRKYGRKTAEKLRFRVGTEPDLPGHWQDSVKKYCQMYDHATAAVREVLPKARVGPGNFLLRPQGERRTIAMKIMKHLASGRNYATGKTGSPVDFLAISLYYAPSGKALERAKTPQAKRSILNAHSHESARLAGRRLKPLRALSPRFKDVPLEIHEFGVLSSELYRGSGPRRGNRGVREGAWVLQTYAVAFDEGFRDIFSWSRRDTTFGRDKPLLSCSAWLRSMLDLGEGGSWYILDRKLATENESSAMALASVKKDAAYVFCSVYNLYRKNDADEELRIELDRSLLPFGAEKKVTVREYLQDKGNNVIEGIHRYLKKHSMIKPEYDNGEVYAPRICSTPPGVVYLKKHAEEYVKMFTDSFDAQPFKGKVLAEGKTVVLTRKVKTPSLLILEVTAK